MRRQPPVRQCTPSGWSAWGKHQKHGMAVAICWGPKKPLSIFHLHFGRKKPTPSLCMGRSVDHLEVTHLAGGADEKPSRRMIAEGVWADASIWRLSLPLRDSSLEESTAAIMLPGNALPNQQSHVLDSGNQAGYDHDSHRRRIGVSMYETAVRCLRRI